MARLEQLLDEYAAVAALDPDKLPAVRAQIWSLVRTAQLHHDLGVEQAPEAAEFDDFVLHIDGYLCEVKDAAIRDGLHILGAAPEGEALVNLVLVILRSAQVWGGTSGALPGLRTALGLDVAGGSRGDTDAYEGTARALVEGLAAAGWDAGAAGEVCDAVLGAGASASPGAGPPGARGLARARALGADGAAAGLAGDWRRGLARAARWTKRYGGTSPPCWSSRRGRWCRGWPPRRARSTRC